MSRREEEPFLSRWARRKRQQGSEGPPPQPEAAEREAESLPPEAPPSGEPVAELPDPDTLGPDADYGAYLRADVPDLLRQKALRRLWRTNPILRSVDMLDDYCEDFTDTATVVAGLRTAYRMARDALAKTDGIGGGAEDPVTTAGSGTTPPDPESRPPGPDDAERQSSSASHESGPPSGGPERD